MKNRSSLILLKSSLKTLAVVSLCASTWQLAQAIPQNTPKTVPYKAESAHDAAWYKAHPHYKASPKRGWIKTLPHRYRIVKVQNQTYYYAHNHYYQRSGNGYIAVKIPFVAR